MATAFTRTGLAAFAVAASILCADIARKPLVAAEAGNSATLAPAGVESFFVTPQKPSELRWTVATGKLSEPVEYIVRDYWQAPVSSGRAKLAAGGTVAVSLALEQGFYEIEFPAAGQRFGVVSLPEFSGTADPFFCIDGALSWLVRDVEVRRGLLRVLRRSGIGMSRERCSWAQVNPAEGSWQWETPRRYETVREWHAEQGIEVLEMCHDAPSWLGHVGKYPADLVQTAEAWRQIGRRWRPTWGALEVWNEPDIFFGANLPADQYVALVKTLSYATAKTSSHLPLVGGVVAHYNRSFLDSAAGNGLLDSVDAFSFHTYGRAPAMEGLIGNYRSWLKAHDREAVPLWLTECGRPWPRGPDRPPREPDVISALDITMKAVEARCCGVARYFAFVYPFYEERTSNFGMMGRRATPLRSMAAYTRLASLLAHTDYLGDLDCGDSSISRARVFGDQRKAVAVLYSGRADATATVRLKLPLLRAEGIDGRELEVAGDGTVPIPDGLVYLWLDRERIGELLSRDTAAMRLWVIRRSKPAPRPDASPVVMRFQWDADVLQARSDGYWFVSGAPKELPLRVRVFNLSDERAELTLRLACPPQTARAIGPDTLPLSIPARAAADASWKVDFSEAFADDGRQELTVTAAGRPAGETARLVIDLHGESTLAQILKRHPQRVRLPIDDLQRWRANVLEVSDAYAIQKP